MKYDLNNAPIGNYVVVSVEHSKQYKPGDKVIVSTFGDSHNICTNVNAMTSTNQVYCKPGTIVSPSTFLVKGE